MTHLEGVKGASWIVNVTRVKLDGVEVSEATLGACSFAGRIGGLAITSTEADPEPGVRLRCRVSAASTASAVVQDDAYLSQIAITFSGGDVLVYQFTFSVLPSAD